MSDVLHVNFADERASKRVRALLLQLLLKAGVSVGQATVDRTIDLLRGYMDLQAWPAPLPLHGMQPHHLHAARAAIDQVRETHAAFALMLALRLYLAIGEEAFTWLDQQSPLANAP